MDAKQLFGMLVAAIILLVAAFVIVQFVPSRQAAAITSFDECAAAGYPVMESYPRQCNANGQHFVEDIMAGGQQTMPVPDEGAMQFNGCAVAGCSGQLCVSAAEAENIVTTCEFRPEYACYKEASCEPQADDTCGWTQTEELTQCLANPPAMDENLQEI